MLESLYRRSISVIIARTPEVQPMICIRMHHTVSQNTTSSAASVLLRLWIRSLAHIQDLSFAHRDLGRVAAIV